MIGASKIIEKTSSFIMTAILSGQSQQQQQLRIDLKVVPNKLVNSIYKIVLVNESLPQKLQAHLDNIENIFQCLGEMDSHQINEYMGQISIKTSIKVGNKVLQKVSIIKLEEQNNYLQIKEISNNQYDQLEMNSFLGQSKSPNDEIKQRLQSLQQIYKKQISSIQNSNKKTIQNVSNKLQIFIQNLTKRIQYLQQQNTQLSSQLQSIKKHQNYNYSQQQQYCQYDYDVQQSYDWIPQQNKKKYMPIDTIKTQQKVKKKVYVPVQQNPIPKSPRSQNQHSKFIQKSSLKLVQQKNYKILPDKHIQYIGQTKYWDTFIFHGYQVKANSKNSCQFKIRIMNTKQYDIIFGITNKNQVKKKGALCYVKGEVQAIGYHFKKGVIARSHVKGKKCLCNGIIEMSINPCKSEITWSINGSNAIKIKWKKMQKQNSIFVPFIEMCDTHDSIKWL